MNALHHAIQKAYAVSGSSIEANKAYLEFIKANFIIPVENNTDEEVRVLFLKDQDNFFLPVFTEKKILDAWAIEISAQIKLLQLSGIDLLKGIEEKVSVCLDLGSPFYKEFSPAEIERMKSMVLKLF